METKRLTTKKIVSGFDLMASKKELETFILDHFYLTDLELKNQAKNLNLEILKQNTFFIIMRSDLKKISYKKEKQKLLRAFNINEVLNFLDTRKKKQIYQLIINIELEYISKTVVIMSSILNRRGIN